jgi:hypothetical protein
VCLSRFLHYINYSIQICLFRDNVPTVPLCSWTLDAALFDGDSTAGPIPTLFAEDPDASRMALGTNIEKVHHDYQRIAKCLFMPEDITLDEALALVKKPRYLEDLYIVN